MKLSDILFMIAAVLVLISGVQKCLNNKENVK